MKEEKSSFEKSAAVSITSLPSHSFDTATSGSLLQPKYILLNFHLASQDGMGIRGDRVRGSF